MFIFIFLFELRLYKKKTDKRQIYTSSNWTAPKSVAICGIVHHAL